MRFTNTSLEGAFVIEVDKHVDARGYFARLFCNREFGGAGLLTQLLQVNISASVEAGTLRGMHCQMAPRAETKIVQCVRGAFWDCILDLRPESKTFGKWFGEILSAENRKLLYVPKGFAHGYLTLEPNTEALYFVDEYYAAEYERGVRWNDPTFGICWPANVRVISDKDATARDFDPLWHLPENDGSES